MPSAAASLWAHACPTASHIGQGVFTCFLKHMFVAGGVHHVHGRCAVNTCRPRAKLPSFAVSQKTTNCAILSLVGPRLTVSATTHACAYATPQSQNQKSTHVEIDITSNRRDTDMRRSRLTAGAASIADNIAGARERTLKPHRAVTNIAMALCSAAHVLRFTYINPDRAGSRLVLGRPPLGRDNDAFHAENLCPIRVQ